MYDSKATHVEVVALNTNPVLHVVHPVTAVQTSQLAIQAVQAVDEAKNPVVAQVQAACDKERTELGTH